MSDTKKENYIESYQFHHIKTNECLECDDFSCEEVCFRGVYKIINKETAPKCIVVPEREDFCIKCHICTTVCKSKAISID
ncbi:MAG: hypothetical protein GF317_18600 [Candidatus Lokiarchaeota archaeon]|nr:hypothetical protein [Candidatus Lokiarchaeota archaeon]MBD3201527.1 hypothetical protein [Candidatus Lokiarchaeota archaeon]